MKKHFLHSLRLLALAGALLALTTVQITTLTSCSTQDLAVQLIQQADYPELPPLRPGAIYSARLENVRRIAQADEQSGAIAPGRYELVTSHLKSRNVLYQTDPDGRDVACIPMLAAMIDNDATRTSNRQVQSIFDKAYKDGLKFTAKLMDIAIANGLYLDGLENAVKAASHIADKANRWRERYPGATTDEIAAQLNDLVRYSAVTTKENYVQATLALISSLEQNGYEVVEVDNRFLGKDGKQDLSAPYRAIHLGVRDGERMIEIQVHDHSSQAIRESTHEIYERMRQMDRNSEEYRRLDEERRNAWQSYVNPSGIESIATRK